MQTAIATANKLPAINKKENMFKNKETVFYLFLVMVMCELCCCCFSFFNLFSTILVDKKGRAKNAGVENARVKKSGAMTDGEPSV